VLARLAAALVVLATTAARAKPASSGTGALVLSGSPNGAEVFVDGEKAGTLPLPGPLSLSVGEHTIKVQKGGFAPLIDVFNIRRKAQTKLDVELVPVAGLLKVSANVEQAHVYVDGKFVCDAPCQTEVAPGSHAVKLSHGGYKDSKQEIASVAGEDLSLEVKLEELPMGLNPYRQAPPPPPKWYEKWWVWTAGVAALGAVAVAIAVPLVEAQKDPVKDFHASYTFTLGR
jgi:hypothetical protein